MKKKNQTIGNNQGVTSTKAKRLANPRIIQNKSTTFLIFLANQISRKLTATNFKLNRRSKLKKNLFSTMKFPLSETKKYCLMLTSKNLAQLTTSC